MSKNNLILQNGIIFKARSSKNEKNDYSIQREMEALKLKQASIHFS